MDRSLKAHRALLHPAWLLALTLLVINDHFLKGSGLLPGWLTGKLSDLAGLLVAPALLAVLLRLSSRRALLLAHAATGAVFAAVKLAPPAAHLLEQLMALGPFRATIVVDPTDLVALPMLWISLRVLVPAMTRPLPDRPAVQRGLAIGGAIACMATSQQNPCAGDPALCNGIPREAASLVIGNTTSAERLVRVRALKSTVTVDCDEMLADPTRKLSRELFAPAETWLIEPTRGLPLQNLGPCSAYLVDADGAPMTLFAWSEQDFPTDELSTSTTEPDAGNKMIGLLLNPTTGALTFGNHPAVFTAPPVSDPTPTPACAVPDAGASLAWSEPAPVGGVISAIESSPDGCHGITFGEGSAAEVFYLCVPVEAMPFKVGDHLDVGVLAPVTTPFAEANDEPSFATGLSLRSESSEVLVVRGNVLAHRALSTSAQPVSEPATDADLASGCLGAHDACGNLVYPLDVTLSGDHVPDSIAVLRPGQSVALDDGYGTLFLVRAEAQPIRDTDCSGASAHTRLLESVLVLDPVISN